MPHGWRSAARSPGSPHGCAPDPPALPASVADALADRTAIDWPTLLRRMEDPDARASLEALRRLDGSRPRVPSDAARDPLGGRWFVLRLCAAAAGIQTAVGIGCGVLAALTGRPLAPVAASLLVTAAFAGAALLLASASSRDRRVLLLFVTFVFAASAFARVVAIDLHLVDAANAVFRGIYPEVFLPAALWQFAVLFPAVPRFTRFDLRARRAAFAVWIVGSALGAINLAAAYGWNGAGLDWLTRDDPRNLFWHLFAATALPAVGCVFVRALRATGSERERVARFGRALAGGAAPFLLFAAARIGSPAFDRWMTTSRGALHQAVGVAVLGGLGALPLLVTLALAIDPPFERPALVPLWLRRWIPTRRRQRERLLAALERVGLTRGGREMRDVVSRELQFGLGARNARLSGVDELPPESALFALLQAAGGPVLLPRDREPFVLLPARERQWLQMRDVAMAAPITLRDGTVAAIALLGPRRGNGAYDARDLWFVRTLLAAAAAGWQSPPQRHDDEAAFECERCGIVAATRSLPCACGAPATLAALPKVLAGKFDVRARLGAGGMGVVYRAHDAALERDVALKTLPSLRDGSVRRLRDEARAMAAASHPALATIYGLEIWHDTPVLVVEYFPAGTLADALARGPLACGAIVALGIRLADALSSMHARGLLHRDLKPANIGLTASGEAKLLDFGLAADFGIPAGTPAYLPPEALAGAPPGVAVDLWGLARVLADAGGERCIRLSAFFARALAESPLHRFPSAAEMRAALEQLRR